MPAITFPTNPSNNATCARAGKTWVYNTAKNKWSVVSAIAVSDEVYDADTWNGATNVAPSKNAVRDKIESLGALSGAVAPLNAAAASVSFSLGAYTSTKFTAINQGTAGNLITVAYSAPANQAPTTAAIVGNALTVTLATKARMTISGAEPGATNVTCYYVEPYDYTSTGRPHSENIDLPAPHTRIRSNGTHWTIYGYSGYNTLIYQSQATGQGGNPYPNSLMYSPPTVGTGFHAPMVGAGISSAGQVITAVNALSALVTASAIGTVTGAVGTLAPIGLVGGEDTTTPGAFEGQLYQVTTSDVWYRWDGARWVEDYRSPVTISATAPADTRTIWFQTSTGKLNVYYNGAWVATA